MFTRIAAMAATFLVALLVSGFSLVSTAQAARGDGGGGTSRSCLTSAARNLLDRIESRFGAMQIISTCRPGATIAGSGRVSKHASGNAIDFDAGGRKGDVVRWLVANHGNGGTMTYSGMSHIHVDIGPHFVSLSGGSRSASSEGRSSRKRTAATSTPSRRTALRSEASGYAGLGASSIFDAR